MAQLPVPRRRGVVAGLSDGSAYRISSLPDGPRAALAALDEAGHDAVLVGGCVRDLVLGSAALDWDVATSATPDEVVALFPGARHDNRFGTVTVPGAPAVEITPYRTESAYGDRRRPDRVSFGASLGDDLARRDFTINAVAWRPSHLPRGEGTLIDPHGGIEDLRAGIVRAVGDPRARFAEDALRLLRAVRFAHRFGFRIEAETRHAVREAAGSASALSGERVRDELLRLLRDPAIRPSSALLDWEDLGVLSVLLPELAALRSVPQAKALRGDALDHSLRCADALSSEDPVLRVAGLLHDVGKAITMAAGRFIGHEDVGADMAEAVMRRLRFATRDIQRVAHLIRHHMFGYEVGWTDAAVRRFIDRVGPDRLDDLFALRLADNLASGTSEPPIGGLEELRARVAAQRDAVVAARRLAIDGHDLQRELGLPPGPRLGAVLTRLGEIVVDDPARNRRTELLELARQLAHGGDFGQRPRRGPGRGG